MDIQLKFKNDNGWDSQKFDVFIGLRPFPPHTSVQYNIVLCDNFTTYTFTIPNTALQFGLYAYTIDKQTSEQSNLQFFLITINNYNNPVYNKTCRINIEDFYTFYEINITNDEELAPLFNKDNDNNIIDEPWRPLKRNIIISGGLP